MSPANPPHLPTREPLLTTRPALGPTPPPKLVPDGESMWQSGRILLGEYEVEGKLGEGGGGTVHLVKSTATGERYAVKRAHFHDDAARADFLTELRVWIDLPRYPHLTTCHFFRTIEGDLAIFAEYVEGGSLSRWIAERRLAGLPSLLSVALQSAWGLHAAHEWGLIHRDVKSGNVLVREDGVVKVTDFGLARGRTGMDGASMLVSAGAMTPAYRSPEQAAGQPLSRQTDVWSWGVTVLEMFVGGVTWLDGQAAPDVLEQHLAGGARGAGSSEMPAGLAELLRRCFRRDPRERPATMGAVADALLGVYRKAVGKRSPDRQPRLPKREDTTRQEDERWPPMKDRPSPDDWLRRARRAEGVAETGEETPVVAASPLGRAAADLAQYGQARAILERVIATGRNELRGQLGYLCLDEAAVHLAGDDVPGARALCARAVGLFEAAWSGTDPGSLAGAFVRGAVVLTRHDFPVALEYLRRAIQLRSESSARDAAQEYFDESHTLIPWLDRDVNVNEIALLLADAAIGAIEQLKDSTWTLRLARVYLLKARASFVSTDNSVALALYDRALQLCGEGAGRLGDPAAARQLIVAYGLKAQLLQKLGQHGNALMLYETALRNVPKFLDGRGGGSEQIEMVLRRGKEQAARAVAEESDKDSFRGRRGVFLVAAVGGTGVASALGCLFLGASILLGRYGDLTSSPYVVAGAGAGVGLLGLAGALIYLSIRFAAKRWAYFGAEAVGPVAPRDQYNLGVKYATGQGAAKDVRKAAMWYRKAAEQNYSPAQHAWGVCLVEGWGVAKNEAEAAKWFRKAAETSNADSQYYLGAMYQSGRGVEKDEAEAVEWYRKAADQNYPSALYSLGVMYAEGRGVTRDEAAGARWVRKAADQEFPHAQWQLGVMYARGRGVEQNEDKAVQWLVKAAARGDASAPADLAKIAENGRGVARDGPLALRWYRRAAENGSLSLQNLLGRMYELGEGVPKDDGEAFKWYRLAADQDDQNAQFRVACMMEGRGTAKSEKEAIAWYRKAVEKNHAPAQYQLALLLEKRAMIHKAGDAPELANLEAAKVWEEALELYRKAAQQNHPLAQHRLASSYLEGPGVLANEAESLVWYRRAAEQGHAPAQYELGVMYESGRGVAKDEREAAEWYRKAAEQNDAGGQYSLGRMLAAGRGTARNQNEALRWFRRAAEQGHASAQTELGFLFAAGRGVFRDESEALRWYQKAAEQNDARGQTLLGELIASWRTPDDDVKAVDWYQKGAAQGYARAQAKLGEMYANGRGVARDQIRAVEWYRRAAEQGDAVGQFNLGSAYARGDGLQRDLGEAEKWYELAAKQGSIPAKHRLIEMNAPGRLPSDEKTGAARRFRKTADQKLSPTGVQHDALDLDEWSIAKEEAEAARWYRLATEKNDPLGQTILSLAAEEGSLPAMCCLASLFDAGRVKAKGPADAVLWFRKAADKNYAPAQLQLGLMYTNGRAVVQDDAEAVGWFRKAADQNYAPAQVQLGLMYTDGRGVAQDEAVAAEWLRKAAEQGRPAHHDGTLGNEIARPDDGSRNDAT